MDQKKKFKVSIAPDENFVDLTLFQFGYERCNPSHAFGPARRQHYLFHYVLSGTGTLYANNANGDTKTFQIHAGQGFLIFPGQTNTYIADAEDPWEYIWLEFDGLRVQQALLPCNLSPDSPVYKSRSEDMQHQMRDEMLYIINHDAEPPFHLIGHLFLFMDYLTRSAKSETGATGNKIQNFYIREALSYIQRNYQNEISVEEIAANSGLTRSYFSKLFRKLVGSSPQQFLLNYRMTKAAELLQTSDWSINDIGNAVGYSNQLHFSRAFKSIYHVSPMQWRKRQKKT